MSKEVGVVSAVVAGAVAGALGTAAMDLLWYGRYRRGGGSSGFVDWDTSSDLQGWDDAPAPAKVGRRVAEAALHRELPADAARLTNNVVHWSTGVGWGAVFGMASATVTWRRWWFGPVFGALVWLSSYGVLVPAGLYEPPWKYDPRTLWQDLSAHQVYGLTTAEVFAVCAPRAARRRRAQSSRS
jgi:hypothetical protein